MHVITNALFILCEIVKKKGINIISVGGSYRSLSTSFLGSVAVQNLDNFNINKAFLSGNAFSLERGLMDPNELEPAFKRKMIEVAQQSFLLIDHTKLNKIAPFTVCEATVFDAIVTDSGIEDSYRQRLKESGIKAIVAT
jgi:DeoR family fructose operon transcriptional repressor